MDTARKGAVLLAALITGMLTGLADEPGTPVSYRNDFGTDEQFLGLNWSSTVGLELRADIGPNPPGDLDGDVLYRAVRCSNASVPARYGTKVFFAPVFSVFSNPTVAGYGTGDVANYNSWARWGLSRNGGTTFDYSVTTDNSRQWKPYSTLDQAHGDARYTRVTNFYATAALQYNAGGTYSAGGAGKTAAFQVDVVALPAQTGERVYIHLNDLGTDDQTNGWAISSDVQLGTNRIYQTDLDTDHDNRGRYFYFPAGTLGTRTASIRITAPEGKFFRQPIAAGRGYGDYYNWRSGAKIGLSRDGTTWDVESAVPNTGTGGYAMTADASTLPAYNRPMTSVWLRVTLFASAGTAGVRPWAGLVTVTGVATVPSGTTLIIR